MRFVDDRASGAAALLAALDAAGRSFRQFGYEQFLAHQSVHWEFAGRTGHAVAPCASVGVLFRLQDDQDRQVHLGVSVWVRDHAFEVSGDATVDDPLPVPGGGGNQRFLRDFRDVRTADLDECITAVARYTAELCRYGSVLDELGVSRTGTT